MTREDKVNEFFKASGKRPFSKDDEIDKSIISCVTEEAEELREAFWQYTMNPTVETRANLCKEWADAQYVLSQVAVYLDIPADASLNRVHVNNMTKVVDGKILRREDGKILKPEGYAPADMRGL